MRKKFFKYLLFGFIGLFAFIGLGLTAAFFAVKLHLTDDPGVVDINDRYFQEIKNRYARSSNEQAVDADFNEAKLFYGLSVLNKYHPKNAILIQNAYETSRNLKQAQQMMEAVNLRLRENTAYIEEINRFSMNTVSTLIVSSKSVFEWMNIREWQDFKIAVAKDQKLIDSAAVLTGVEPRLIVALLVGEQIRLFNSNREAYKKWIGPLKILSVETTFSLGVTGIKVPTAQTIERNLKDSASVFYLGKPYEDLLDFKTPNHAQERFNRLTSYKNHFYSYLYAALNVKQIKAQWEKAGFPIDNRPEILATLYNIGFEASVPKENPEVGGSGIHIKGTRYSFGAIAYEFYYSGELFDLFPFKNARFDFTDV